MGKHFSGMFSLFLAVLLGGAGAALSLWVAAAAYRSDWALPPALWAMEHSPLPLYASATRVADDLIQRNSLIAAGVVAVVLCVMALSSLRSARLALRAADASHDGKATIEIKAGPLRVGRPVEGAVWLEHGPERGERYRLELSCSRGRGSDDTAYCEELLVTPVATPVGWNLPFRFAVPLIAPASGASSFTSGPGYLWRLAVQRASGRSAPSRFTLDLAPALADELRSLEKGEPGPREPALRQPAAPAARAPGAAPAAYGRPEQRAPASSVYEMIHEEARLQPPLHERPALRHPFPVDDVDAVPSGASLPVRIVKWLFLALFGGALAIAGVALVTAVLISYLF